MRNTGRLRREARIRRHRRIRRKISGTADAPRLSVFRSSRHIYAQLIDDERGETLAASSTVAQDVRDSVESTGTVAAAAEVGKRLAELAASKGIERAHFDRGGFQYHGRVRALAEAAREAGLDLGRSREPKRLRRDESGNEGA